MANEIAMSTVGRNEHAASERGGFGQANSPYRNVGERGRLLSLLTGAGLTFYGLHRGSWLGATSFLIGASLLHRGWSGYCLTYDQLGINTATDGRPRPGVRAQHGRKVKAAIHVNRDRRDVYDFWRNLQNLPRVMRHLESVTPLDQTRSQWTAHAPLGQTLSWEAEIINERPGEVIAWQSLPGSQVDTAGSVHLYEGRWGSGTDVVVSLKYDPPGGHVADRLAHLLSHALEDELAADLQAFKQSLEAGESPTAAQQPMQTR